MKSKARMRRRFERDTKHYDREKKVSAFEPRLTTDTKENT